jgi:hypothetical protein
MLIKFAVSVVLLNKAACLQDPVYSTVVETCMALQYVCFKYSNPLVYEL